MIDSSDNAKGFRVSREHSRNSSLNAVVMYLFQTRRSKTPYSNEDVAKAVAAVKSGEKSYRDASKQFGVPTTTLFSKLKGYVFEKLRPGPTPYMTSTEETSIEEWIVNCSKRGHPRTPLDIRFAVKRILDEFPRSNPFTDNLPSYSWYRSFLRRHPNIKSRKPEALSVASANITENDLKGWWKENDKYFKENNLIGIFTDPRRIANCDESRFEFNACPGKVLVEKESKNSYMTQSGGNKSGCTVMHTVS